MSVFNISGVEISNVYDVAGESLSDVYDINGENIFSGSDYDKWSTAYQHTILQARDSWKTEYRADNSVVPLMIHTDEHNRLSNNTKPTFDYLALAVKWSEVSAIIGLGDVCGGYYDTTKLDNMLLALSSIADNKQIKLAGNHDIWLDANNVITDETFTYMQETYFNNSAYSHHSKFENRGMEVVIDTAHNIKYVCVQCFYFVNGTNYKYSITEDAMDWLLDQLEADDGYDIIILSHIQPLATSRTWYYPPVDGNPASSTTKARNYSSVQTYGVTSVLEGLAHARKNKLSGTINDSEGVTHSYDFSSCTSDVLCWLCGHAHEDSYAYDEGDVPIILFDSYSYANYPLFFVNVDKTQQRVNIWKFDEANNIYNFQVPFTEPVSS